MVSSHAAAALLPPFFLATTSEVFRTSSSLSAKTIFNSRCTFLGTSTISFLFRAGAITVVVFGQESKQTLPQMFATPGDKIRLDREFSRIGVVSVRAVPTSASCVLQVSARDLAAARDGELDRKGLLERVRVEEP